MEAANLEILPHGVLSAAKTRAESIFEWAYWEQVPMVVQDFVEHMARRRRGCSRFFSNLQIFVVGTFFGFAVAMLAGQSSFRGGGKKSFRGGRKQASRSSREQASEAAGSCAS